MQTFELGGAGRGIEQVLIIGAHSDDIEIGAGGTIRELLKVVPNLEVRWIVLAAAGSRADEARASASEILRHAASHTVEIYDFRDGFFPYEGGRLKETFENLKRSCEPDVIFTHHRDDLHQDHRLVGELTWNTFRDHFILEYEVPKYDGGLGTPNVLVPLRLETVQRKVTSLIAHFKSQRNKAWFSEDTFKGLMRLRGIECHSPTAYAEGFYCRKAVWRIGASDLPRNRSKESS